MPIDSLYFTNVGPFSEIKFDFHSKVNVLAGPNNSGKSTVLWTLAELLVYPFAMPTKLLRSEESKWRMDVSWKKHTKRLDGAFPAGTEKLGEVFEHIGHTSFVPAQRHSTNYRSPGPVPTLDPLARLDEDIWMLRQARPDLVREHDISELRQLVRRIERTDTPEMTRRRSLIRSGPSLMTDTAVLQKIINLDYDAYRLRRPEMRTTVDKVASIASEIMKGFPIRLDKVGEDYEGLYQQVDGPYGSFPFDVLSQGTQSIILSLAHFILGYAEYYDFPTDFDDKPGILIIDEIDAHLHPTWQRRIIPTLTRHFPDLQIFCSTHSPLMLAGLESGQVQLLEIHDDGAITVTANESDVRGWTADEILLDLFDLPTPTDLETSEDLERLEELSLKEHLSPSEAEDLERLRTSMSRRLLSGPTSSQVFEFANELRRAQGEPAPRTSPTDKPLLEDK